MQILSERRERANKTCFRKLALEGGGVPFQSLILSLSRSLLKRRRYVSPRVKSEMRLNIGTAPPGLSSDEILARTSQESLRAQRVLTRLRSDCQLRRHAGVDRHQQLAQTKSKLAQRDGGFITHR